MNISAEKFANFARTLDFLDDWVRTTELIEFFLPRRIASASLFDAFGWKSKFVKKNLWELNRRIDIKFVTDKLVNFLFNFAKFGAKFRT